MQAVFRGACAVMAVFFVYCVWVQTNDPDPVGWILVYGLAGLLSALGALRRLPSPVPLGLALVSLVWALSLVRPAFSSEKAMFADAPQELSLLDREEGREMLGLSIVVVWSALLWWTSRRAEAARATS
jgi:hypothetical protein